MEPRGDSPSRRTFHRLDLDLHAAHTKAMGQSATVAAYLAPATTAADTAGLDPCMPLGYAVGLSSVTGGSRSSDRTDDWPVP